MSISSLVGSLWSAVLLGTFRSCVLDVTSFAINLGQRRDATFFLCGEMCKYINRLCFRIYQPDTVPLESAWFLLMDFRISQGKPMSDEDFLVRLKIASKVTSASNLKAAGLHFNKKSSKAAIDKTAENAKSDFVKSAREFIKFLFPEYSNTPSLDQTSSKDWLRLIHISSSGGPWKLLCGILTACIPPSNCVPGFQRPMSQFAGTSTLPYWITFEPTILLSSTLPAILLISLTSSWDWSFSTRMSIFVICSS